MALFEVDEMIPLEGKEGASYWLAKFANSYILTASADCVSEKIRVTSHAEIRKNARQIRNLERDIGKEEKHFDRVFKLNRSAEEIRASASNLVAKQNRLVSLYYRRCDLEMTLQELDKLKDDVTDIKLQRWRAGVLKKTVVKIRKENTFSLLLNAERNKDIIGEIISLGKDGYDESRDTPDNELDINETVMKLADKRNLRLPDVPVFLPQTKEPKVKESVAIKVSSDQLQRSNPSNQGSSSNSQLKFVQQPDLDLYNRFIKLKPDEWE